MRITLNPVYRASFIAAGMTAFAAVSVWSMPACAQPTTPDAPKRTLAQCLDAAYGFSPTNDKAIKTIFACAKSADEAAAIIARLSKSAMARSSALQGSVPPSSGSNEPVAYFVNGVLITKSDFAAKARNLMGTPDAAGVVGLSADQLVPFARMMVKQGEQNNAAISAFNISAAAASAGANEAARQAKALNGGFCAYRVNSISAATGLVSLASNAAVYTRSQLGILSLIAPIIFSRCENVTPPSKPTLSLSAGSIDKANPATLTATETGYTGSFTVTASAQGVIDYTPVPNSSPAQFTIAVHPGYIGTIPITLTVSDDHGQSSIIALNVTGT